MAQDRTPRHLPKPLTSRTFALSTSRTFRLGLSSPPVDPEEPDADLRRQFDAIVAGMNLGELQALAQVLPLRPESEARPELRRPPLADRRAFTVTMSLDGSVPLIWRRLVVRSDITLDVLHRIIQSAFDWWDYHLHRFSLGGDVWDRTSQVFACQEELDQADVDDGVVLDSMVRLDEVLQEPGDVLHYVYDYGDNWELTLRLDAVGPHSDDSPSVLCIAGERAAPPEDCGHLVTAAELAEVLDDPAEFSLTDVNTALHSSAATLLGWGISPGLVDLVSRLRHSAVGEDVTARALDLVTTRPEPSDDEWRSALRAHQWFLDRAADAGIPLTPAGYLRPADVVDVAPLVPCVADWLRYGKNNRESGLAPLLDFRQSLQKMGLLRKSKGTLLITKAGRDARGDVRRLRDHLATRLARVDDDPWVAQSSQLILLYAATSAGEALPLDAVAAALREFGWRVGTGPVEEHHLYRAPILDVIRNVSAQPVTFKDSLLISPAAAHLARAALRTDT